MFKPKKHDISYIIYFITSLPDKCFALWPITGE